jgi:hypothetical protein
MFDSAFSYEQWCWQQLLALQCGAEYEQLAKAAGLGCQALLAHLPHGLEESSLPAAVASGLRAAAVRQQQLGSLGRAGTNNRQLHSTEQQQCVRSSDVNVVSEEK